MKQFHGWRGVALVVCVALVLVSCAETPLSGSKREELAYVEQLCFVQPMVGDARGMTLKLNAQHEKLQSAKGHITAEKYRRLSQDLKDYSAQWELLNQANQRACRSWALCQYREPVGVSNGCQDEREAMERRQKAAQDLLVQLSIEVQIPPSAETPPPVENRIFFYERYGGEWHTSNKEPILFADNKAFLRNNFVEGREYRFSPTIHNGNKKTALAKGLKLFINLPIELTVRAPPPWIVAGSHGEFVQYSAVIAVDIPAGSGESIPSSLFITFPKHGRYPARYSIHGKTTTNEGFEAITGTFYFDLTG